MVGRNCTSTAHDVFGCRVLPLQPSATLAKSPASAPLTVTLPIDSGAVPALARVTVSGGALLSGLVVQYLPAPEHLIYLALIGVLVVQAVGVAFMAETVSRKPGALGTMVPDIKLPPTEPNKRNDGEGDHAAGQSQQSGRLPQASQDKTSSGEGHAAGY